jgi:hypothetical protein
VAHVLQEVTLGTTGCLSRVFQSKCIFVYINKLPLVDVEQHDGLRRVIKKYLESFLALAALIYSLFCLLASLLESIKLFGNHTLVDFE